MEKRGPIYFSLRLPKYIREEALTKCDAIYVLAIRTSIELVRLREETQVCQIEPNSRPTS